MNSNPYERVFSHGDGLKVLDDLIATFHAKILFDRESTTQTAFNCGQKDVIDYILARIKEAETNQ